MRLTAFGAICKTYQTYPCFFYLYKTLYILPAPIDCSLTCGAGTEPYTAGSVRLTGVNGAVSPGTGGRVRNLITLKGVIRFLISPLCRINSNIIIIIARTEKKSSYYWQLNNNRAAIEHCN